MQIGVISLGCSKNRVDTEAMLAKLTQNGHELTQDMERAEALIVNTCGFILPSKTESIDTILEMAEYKRKGVCKVLIATGCLTERYSDELLKEMPEVDVMLGINQFHRICEAIDTALAGERVLWTGDDKSLTDTTRRVLTTPSHYAYLKISDGCDNRCSYCAIPNIRGSKRCQDMGMLLGEAQTLADGGVKELIVVAQDTAAYEPSLTKLLKALCQIEPLKWIRVLYTYPERITDELLNVMASEQKICEYIDMPMQHVNGAVLRAMNRRGDAQTLSALYKRIRSLSPAFSLRTTAIAGFPGETDEQFEAMLSFFKEHPFDHLGVFPYSQEEGTAAAAFPSQLPERVRTRRAERLMAAQREISKNLKAKRVGGIEEALIDFITEDGITHARTRYEAPEVDGIVMFKALPQHKAGDFVKIKITGSDEYDLHGEAIT